MATFIEFRMNKNIYSQHERQAVVYQVPEIYAKQRNCWQEANLAACRRAAAEGYEVLKRGARIAAGSFFGFWPTMGYTHFCKINIWIHHECMTYRLGDWNVPKVVWKSGETGNLPKMSLEYLRCDGMVLDHPRLAKFLGNREPKVPFLAVWPCAFSCCYCLLVGDWIVVVKGKIAQNISSM